MCSRFAVAVEMSHAEAMSVSANALTFESQPSVFPVLENLAWLSVQLMGVPQRLLAGVVIAFEA